MREATGNRTRRTLHLLLLGFLFLALLVFIGCAMINSFIFLPDKEVRATPAERSILYKEVWFQTGDGVQLNGWFVDGRPGMPLLLYFHGNGGNLSDNLEYIALLHGRGFPIFIFDYRGYGKSSGQPLKEEDLYQDGRAALSYLGGLGWQRERIIFFGQSLGAAVALQLALESPPAGLVMESSFTRMKDIVRYTSAFGYYTIGWWGIDMSFDNLSKIGALTVPLFMIHGEHDQVVPLAMTMTLFQRAPQPKLLHIVRGGGHCDVLKADRAAYLSAWTSYLHAVSAKKGVAGT